MITFKITLLLAFNLIPEVKDNAGKKGKKGKAKKPGKDKKGSKKKKGKSQSPTKIAPLKVEYPPFVIEVDRIVGSARISYELIPKTFKYEINVVCWGSVAQIFTADGTKLFRTYCLGNYAWVPIQVEHSLHTLSTSQLMDLSSHTIMFNLNLDNDKFKKILAPPQKLFFINEKDIGTKNFVEVFLENPNSVDNVPIVDEKTKIVEQYMRDIVTKWENYPSKNEVVTWIHPIDQLHSFKIFEIITKFSEGKEIECKDIDEMVYYQPPKPEPKGGKKKGKNKGKTKKEKKKDTKSKKPKKVKLIQVKFPGESLFTDSFLAIYKHYDSNANIEKSFVLISVDDLLTPQQKFELNPIIIKILKINNLPKNVLLEHGYKNLFVSCEVPSIANFNSVMKPIAEKIKINEARFISGQSLELLELLQSQRLYLQIYGIREIETNKLNEADIKLFGAKSDDKLINERKTVPIKSLTCPKSGPSLVKLAMVYCDISSILKNICTFKEKVQLHNPKTFFCKNIFDSEAKLSFMDRLSLHDVHLNEGMQKTDCDTISPLSEELLIKLGTTLKIELRFLAPQILFKYVHDCPEECYSRLLIIVNNEEIAKELLTEILLSNQDINPPHFLIPYYQMLEFVKLTNADYANLLSGFFIDNGDSYIFFIEGLSDGPFVSLYSKVRQLSVYEAKIFYNSNHIFDKRLFGEYICAGGFYIVTLAMPIQDILKKKKVFIKGNMPLPCWRALMKFDLLFKSNMFKTVLQYNLLPTLKELMSLAFEFGFQLRWKK